MKKMSYITLLSTENYLKGVIVLKRSLDEVKSKYDLHCMVSRGISERVVDILEKNGIKTIRIDSLGLNGDISNSVKDQKYSHWNNCWDKLNIFNLTQFDKIVYLDADMMVVQNIDELFDKPHMSASSDGFYVFGGNRLNELNAGLLVVEPNEQTFADLIKFLNGLPKDKMYQDQIAMQKFFSGWGDNKELHLPETYNMWASYLLSYPRELVENCKVYHFIGKNKPYMINTYLKNENEVDKIHIKYMEYLKDFNEDNKIKLSIIIPQYKETEEQMHPLFSILNCQENVDFSNFEVVLVNDCSDCEISREYLKQFNNLNVKSLRTPQNVGSGLCRQYGIDNSSGEFIWFIDADDVVFSVLSVAKVLNSIKNVPDGDIFRGFFLQEIAHEGLKEHSYLKKNDITWLHGKIYRREFLRKHNLRFPKEIRVNEDSFFNGVAFNLDKKMVEIDDILVIWKLNPNSITRMNGGEIHITGYNDFIKSKELVFEFLKDKIPQDRYLEVVVMSFIFFYLNAQGKMWLKFNDFDLQDKIDWEITVLYEKYKEQIYSLNTNEFDEIYQKVRTTMFFGNSFREKETFEGYYLRLKSKFVI